MPENSVEAEGAKVSGRPAGVVALAGFVILFSILIATACAAWFYQIVLFLLHSPKSSVVEVESLAYIFVPLAWLSLAALAWIAFTAGLDLWRMRSRGRKLTLVTMSLILIYGVILTWAGVPYDWGFASVGIAMCVIGISSVGYLLFPSLRSQFHE